MHLKKKKSKFHYLELTCNTCSLLRPNLHVPFGLYTTVSEVPASNHCNMESLLSMLTLNAVAFSCSPPCIKKIKLLLKAIFTFIWAETTMTTGTTNNCLVLNCDLLLSSLPLWHVFLQALQLWRCQNSKSISCRLASRLLQCLAPPLWFSQS